MYKMYDCDFKWPNGAHIAVVFNMSWETPEHAVGARPGAKYKRAMRPIYEAAFADTGGVQRLVDLWDRMEIPTSCYVDGLTVEMFPRLAKEVADRGHEFLVQGWTHEFLYDMTVEEQAAAIARTNVAVPGQHRQARLWLLQRGRSSSPRRRSPFSPARASPIPAGCAMPRCHSSFARTRESSSA